jgi:hypothetical protein
MRKLLFVLGLGAFAVLAWAPATEAAILNQWRGPLDRADQLVQKGKYAKAERIARKAAKQIGESVSPGTAIEETLGNAVMLRALSQAGMGNEDYGVWLWHTALNIHPDLADHDLAPYGSPGELLAQNPLGTPKKGEADVAGEGPDSKAKYQRALSSNRKQPALPQSVRCMEGKIFVWMNVGVDSRPNTPLVTQKPPSPLMTYATLEALWGWDYQPAQREGVEEEGYFGITFNFN